MALGRWKNTNTREKKLFVAEFPLKDISLNIFEQLKRKEEVIIADKYEYHDSRKHYKMVIHAKDGWSCLEIIRDIHKQHQAIPERIIEDFKDYLKQHAIDKETI